MKEPVFCRFSDLIYRFLPRRVDVTMGVSSVTPAIASLASRIIASVTRFSISVTSFLDVVFQQYNTKRGPDRPAPLIFSYVFN